MPTTDDLKARANARALRKAAREGNIERAQTEALAQAEKSAEQEAAGKPKSDPTNVNPKPAPSTKQPKATRAERTLAERKRAEREAQADAERAPAEIDVIAETERWNGTGNPPLHILNTVAAKLDAEVRDEGKTIAAAAAKSAYETYIGKVAGPRNRHARMRAQIAAGEAAIAAREEKSA